MPRSRSLATRLARKRTAWQPIQMPAVGRVHQVTVHAQRAHRYRDPRAAVDGGSWFTATAQSDGSVPSGSHNSTIYGYGQAQRGALAEDARPKRETNQHVAGLVSTVSLDGSERYRKTRLMQPQYHPLDLGYPGLEVLNQDPPVFLVHNFLSLSSCKELINAARARQLPCVEYDNRAVVN